MSEPRRHNTIVLLFLFIAAGLGLFAALSHFGLAIGALTKEGNAGKGAALCLIDGTVNLAFSLFVLSFGASYKTKETPESIVDLISLAFFIRVLCAGFFIFHMLPIEAGGNLAKLQFQYISFAGFFCSFGQTLSIAISLGLMGKDDMQLEDAASGRGGVIAVEAYLTGKAPSTLKSEQQAKAEGHNAETTDKDTTPESPQDAETAKEKPETSEETTKET